MNARFDEQWEKRRDAAEARLPSLVLEHIQTLSDSDFADFLTQYVLADPQVLTALRRLCAHRTTSLPAEFVAKEILHHATRIYGADCLDRAADEGTV